jgi:hypothetical protein
LNLSSDPPGADISIRGIGDYAPGMHLKPGEYTVRLRLYVDRGRFGKGDDLSAYLPERG